jgi:hypothetical protein
MTPNSHSGWQLAGPNLREDPEIWARGCGRSDQEHGLPANRKLVRIRIGIQNLQRLPAHAELFRRWGAKIALPGPMRQIAGALIRPWQGGMARVLRVRKDLGSALGAPPSRRPGCQWPREESRVGVEVHPRATPDEAAPRPGRDKEACLRRRAWRQHKEIGHQFRSVLRALGGPATRNLPPWRPLLLFFSSRAGMITRALRRGGEDLAGKKKSVVP